MTEGWIPPADAAYKGEPWIRAIEWQFDELFGTPPWWSLAVPVSRPPEPAVLCARRPDVDTPRVRIRPGAYGGPIPARRDATWLARWVERIRLP